MHVVDAPYISTGVKQIRRKKPEWVFWLQKSHRYNCNILFLTLKSHHEDKSKHDPCKNVTLRRVMDKKGSQQELCKSSRESEARGDGTGAIGEGKRDSCQPCCPRLPCLESLIRLQQGPGFISTDQENHCPATLWFLHESWGRSRGHVLSGKPGRPCSLESGPHRHLQTRRKCKGTAILVSPIPYRLSGQPDGKTRRMAPLLL